MLEVTQMIALARFFANFACIPIEVTTEVWRKPRGGGVKSSGKTGERAERVLYKAYYRCQFNTGGTEVANAKPASKNTHCEATLVLTLKVKLQFILIA